MFTVAGSWRIILVLISAFICFQVYLQQ